MTAEFSLFKRLPGEIRQAIWSFASNTDLNKRDERLPEDRRVHFFNISSVNEDILNDALGGYISTGYRRKYGYIPSCFAAPPGCGPHCLMKGACPDPDGNPWRHNNDSRYLDNSGLWTACRESRQAAQKNYEMKESKTYRGVRPVAFRRTPDDESHYFTVNQQEDLFVLRLDDGERIMVGEVGVEDPSLPFLPHSIHEGLAPYNIAVEFKPELELTVAMKALAEKIYNSCPNAEALFVIEYLPPKNAKFSFVTDDCCFWGREHVYFEESSWRNESRKQFAWGLEEELERLQQKRPYQLANWTTVPHVRALVCLPLDRFKREVVIRDKHDK